MPRRPITQKRTDAEIAQLLELIESGSSALHAAAALKRKTASVQKKARGLGKALPGVRKVKADLRASGALEPSRPER